MLFIIASNNPQQWENNEIETTGEHDESIDSVDLLIERLEQESQEQELEDENREDLNEEGSILNDDIAIEDSIDDDRWFFSRLFWRWWEDTSSSDQIVSDSDTVELDSIDSDKSWELDESSWDIQQWTQEDHEEFTQEYISRQNTSNMLTRWDTISHNIYNWLPIIKDSVNWYSSTSVIWDMYTVNTHSLKLNNKYFTETLWYLLRDDVIEQISDVNVYWCFEAKVIDSSTALYRVWYVCEKHLSKIELGDGYSTNQHKVHNDIIFPETQIWDIIQIEAQQLDIYDMALFQWDSIEQVSEIDDYWCFFWVIHSVQFMWYANLLGQSYEFCFDTLLWE